MPSSTELRHDRMRSDHPAPEGHRWRYHLAAGFLEPGDTIIDAACGIGYGAEIIQTRSSADYIGVDRDVSETTPLPGCQFIEADLRTWTSPVGFDVFAGFETLEHLTDYRHYVAHAKQARRWILVSVPVVPTTHLNPHHCHNFAPGAVAALFIDDRWRLWQSVLQPAELSEVYVFGRQP